MVKDKPHIAIGPTSFLIGEGLKSLFTRDDRFCVSEMPQLPEQFAHAKPEGSIDLIILDSSAPGFNDSFLTHLKETSNPPAILLLLDNIVRDQFNKYSAAGIENMLFKDTAEQELLSAAESALKGRKFFSSEILEMLLEPTEGKQTSGLANQLTPSEKEIVQMISGGFTTKEIAARRNISFHTVNTHRKNIFRKLDVTNTSEMIMVAIKSGWIDNIEYYI